MPEIKDIEKFKNTLNSLGNERSILAGRGEEIEDIKPDEGLPADLSSLLSPSDVSSESEEENFPEDDSAEESIEMRSPEENDEIFDEQIMSKIDSLDEEVDELGEEFSLPESVDSIGSGAEESFGNDSEDGTENLNFDLPTEEAVPPPQTEEKVEDENTTDELSDLSFGEPDGSDDISGLGDEASSIPQEPPKEENQEIEQLSDEGIEDFSLPESVEGDFVEESDGSSLSSAEDTPDLDESFEMSEPLSGEPIDEIQEPVEKKAEQKPSPKPVDKKPSEPEEIEGDDIVLPEGFGVDTSSENFSLGELSDEFFDKGDFQEAGEEDLNLGSAVSEEISAAEEDFSLRESDLKAIQKTLESYPMNLKIVIEELIGEKNLSGDDLKKLLEMLVAGAGARDAALLAGRLIGKKIKIPASYEKISGLEFESLKESFSYKFWNIIFPGIIKFAFAGIVALTIAYFFWNFVYKPVNAFMLYSRGLKSISKDLYTEGNKYFDKAVSNWRVKKQYYKYAEAFIDKKQFNLAQEKYENLLQHYPGDEKGILDYAKFESRLRGDYPKADGLLKQLLDKDMYNFNGLLNLGDNYLEWAKTSPDKFEEARRSYAILLEKYGEQREVLFRMMKYFIRTDQLEEVKRLKDQFMLDTKKDKIDPDIFAELGGYLVDKKDFDDVRKILLRVIKQDPKVPEAFYHLARYYRIMKEYPYEEQALKEGLEAAEKAFLNTKERVQMLIDFHNRIGETEYRKEHYIEAEKSFLRAKKMFEESNLRINFSPWPDFGKIYSNLADIYYFISNDTDTALDLYNQAEANNYFNKEMNYKKGFIYYKRTDYKNALMEFYQSSDNYIKYSNLLFSMANSFYWRNDYYAAQGYYEDLIEMLENEKSNFQVLEPNTREDHKKILTGLMKSYNNLGASLYNISLKSTADRRQKHSKALLYFTKASEIFDFLTRDRDTSIRSESINLSYLNTRALLYPKADVELQIYTEIPKIIFEKEIH